MKAISAVLITSLLAIESFAFIGKNECVDFLNDAGKESSVCVLDAFLVDEVSPHTICTIKFSSDGVEEKIVMDTNGGFGTITEDEKFPHMICIPNDGNPGVSITSNRKEFSDVYEMPEASPVFQHQVFLPITVK